jgi:GT2 family glycosyltransferase
MTMAASEGQAGPGISRLGFVTADPGRTSDADVAVRSLLESLVAYCRHTEICVILTESPGSTTLLDGWRAAGVKVFVGPPDPDMPRHGDWGLFGQVIVTESGLLSCARAWIEKTQPQATRVLFLPELRFRQVGTPPAFTPPEERPGLEALITSTQRLLLNQVDWADAVWCENDADAALLRAWVPDRDVRSIPPGSEPLSGRVPWGARAGIVIGALEGHDLAAGTEEAAVRALREVVPLVRWRQPDLLCTVVSDCPSEMLRSAAERAGASVAGSPQLRGVVAGARVMVAAHAYGQPPRSLITECLRAGTPVIATAAAVPPQSAALAARAWRLVSDEGQWLQAVDRGDGVLASQFDPAAREGALTGALAAVGITPGSPVRRSYPDLLPPPGRWRPRSRANDGLRPAPFGSPPAPGFGSGPADEHERYRLWAARYGPTPAVLESISADLEHLGVHPKISVVMPVYNTDPHFLTAAIDSVRAQNYAHWELCLGNDGSDRAETVAVLDSLREDPRITIVDLPHRGGIAAATNAALSAAGGDFAAFMDHDDELKPHALAQVARWLAADPGLDIVYTDEDKIGPDGQLRDAHLKPDWSPDLLLAQNYISHLTVARLSLVEEIGGLRPDFDGSQDYDLLLRLTERTDRIGHIPEPLYSWRAAPGSFAADTGSKPYAIAAARSALSEALARRGVEPVVQVLSEAGRYRVRYPLPGRPRVTIIVPTRDRLDLLHRCLDSVQRMSTYDNYEIVIVDNQSCDGDTLSYLAGGPWRVIRYPHPFNYARMVNLAASSVETDALLFLNNDTEVVSPGWIEAMLEHAMRPEVGMVGCRLYFADGTPQHEGIMIGTWGDWANNINHRGYFFRGEMVRNASAVTGACCMIRPPVYRRVGGADERLRVAYNDVDLCLRIRQAGYEIVYTPYAELYHHEGSTRKDYQHREDAPVFRDRWDPKGILDPYYSPVFSDAVPFQIEV